ncbi:MAG: aldo/keto reductase [Bryobacteraceae bacterium]
MTTRRNFLAAGCALPAVPVSTQARPTIPAGATGGVKPARTEVRYAVLGRTGLRVSQVSFGCMITSDISVLERALDLGINHFDTARVYGSGNNERMVGAALKRRRKDVVIATKTLDPADKAAALADLDRSLQTLGTDYVDIWYLHDKRKAEDITDELIDAQQTARQAGKIRFAGVSVHSGHGEVIPAAIRTGKIDVILTTYNFAMDPSIENLIAQAHQAGLGVVAMKVMAGSFRLPDSDYFEKGRALLKRPGAPVAALRWVLRNPNVDCAIPSMTDHDQLEENLQAMAAPFGETDQKLLSHWLEQIRNVYCRMCGSCEGRCSQGLPVADMLRYLMYAENYGQFSLGREHFQQLPEPVQAVRCSGCLVCTVRCPQGIPVAARLSKAQELFA